MRKCNVCGKRFRLLKKNRYEVVKRPIGLKCLTEGTTYFNAFDCPHCGCQNIVGVVEVSNIQEADNVGVVLDKIRAEIEMYELDCRLQGGTHECEKCNDNVFGSIYRIIDKYKVESEGEE